jgi:hypothetical protein
MKYTVHCPQCDGTRLFEVARALVQQEVFEWAYNPENDQLAGIKYGLDEIDLESCEPVDYPYYCKDCSADLCENELVVKADGVVVNRDQE